MNSERHYPTAFKFASVAMMAFAVWIFHQSNDRMVKAYSVIEFIATLNGWAASENDENKYGDLFLLNDACCSACFFLTMLDLSKGIYKYFYIYSSILFVLYFLWNRLLIVSFQAKKEDLHRYQICNVGGFLYSCVAIVLVIIVKAQKYDIVVNVIGIIMWAGILAFWFVDAYFGSYKKKAMVLVLEENKTGNELTGNLDNVDDSSSTETDGLSTKKSKEINAKAPVTTSSKVNANNNKKVSGNRKRKQH